STVALVDHHAHGTVGPPSTLDEFRGLFSESEDPRQWPHVATGLTYRRAIRALATLLGCEPCEEAVFALRSAADPDAYAARLLRAARRAWLTTEHGSPCRRGGGGA